MYFLVRYSTGLARLYVPQMCPAHVCDLPFATRFCILYLVFSCKLFTLLEAPRPLFELEYI